MTVQASLERLLTTIVVRSAPPGASVFLDGEERTERTPTVIQKVPAGERYKIKVSKKGFKPWTKTVEPEDDESVTVEAPLERLLTTIVVRSAPPGASVFLDGRERTERTPTVIQKVPAGELYEIKVAKKGFKPWTRTVEPEDDKSVAVEAPLERLLTTIVVRSTPPGASVFFDGKERKELTPTVIQKVPSGERYEIRLAKKGFKPWVKTVEPEDDKSVTVKASLETILTTIVVRSTPPDASVFLDDKQVRGSTPVEIPDISADDAHKITVKKKGYRSVVQTVTLEPGERKEVQVALKPLFGEIRVSSEPPGAEVYLNGKDMALKTPTRLSRLSPGKYKVTLKKKGYKAWEDEVSLGDSGPLDLPKVKLQKAFGRLNLSSSPWTFVYYMGKEIGTTPLANIRFQEGIHKLILKNPRLNIEEEVTVTIVAGEVTIRSIDITGAIKGKLKGQLKIRVAPWADVYVDGKLKGTTPLKPLELMAGEHTVLVKNEKLAKQRSFRIIIKPNQVHSLDVNLLKKK